MFNFLHPQIEVKNLRFLFFSNIKNVQLFTQTLGFSKTKILKFLKLYENMNIQDLGTVYKSEQFQFFIPFKLS